MNSASGAKSMFRLTKIFTSSPVWTGSAHTHHTHFIILSSILTFILGLKFCYPISKNDKSFNIFALNCVPRNGDYCQISSAMTILHKRHACVLRQRNTSIVLNVFNSLDILSYLSHTHTCVFCCLIFPEAGGTHT